MKKIIIILFLSATAINTITAQRETDNWLFGKKAGINFNKGKIGILSNLSQIEAPAGCSSISDKNGNLLFYSNGKTIWNKNHTIMENGTDLAGDTSNTQTSIIIPQPNNNSIYYIFTTREIIAQNPVLNPGVYYSKIEISDKYPLGKVMVKNSRIIQFASSEKITAVHHADGKSIWVVALTSSSTKTDAPKDTFTTIQIDTTGIITPLKKHTLTRNILPKGAMKFSPNGKILAISDYASKFVYLYNFNSSTGDISKYKVINPKNTLSVDHYPYGIEFSPNSKILYFSTLNNRGFFSIFQYLLDNNDVLNSPNVIHTSEDYIGGDLQLAINGKIYVALTKGEGDFNDIKFLGVINNPENVGSECNYKHNSLNIDPGNSKKGLPNFIQSYFRNRIIVNDNCISNSFDFSTDSYAQIKSINWSFGDGSISEELNPVHKYSIAGTYIVKATITFNNTTTSLYKEVSVYPLPVIKSNEKLTQCDMDDDGVEFFDLYDIKNKITNPDLKQEFKFYNSKIEAENDQNEISSPEKYKNESNPQEIFVKIITDKGCSDITNFFIEAAFAKLDNIKEMAVCEDSDYIINNSKGIFNLSIKRNDIRNEFNLPQSTTLKFYPTLNDAQLTENELDKKIISQSKTIWVRAETNTGCGGIEPINLIVNNTPKINIDDTYTICSNSNTNYPIVLDANILNDRYEWKDDLNNILSTDREFTLTNSGTYTLTVYNTQNEIECSNSKTFIVNNVTQPTFNEIKISNNLNSVYVSVIGDSSYEFSLDSFNYFGNNLSYTFQEVEPGPHTIYVRDINLCEQPIQKDISVNEINGFPSFFTPNDDGENDVWQIKGENNDFTIISPISIFNRFGKSIIQIDSKGEGWNGYFNGKLLPSSDYWFSVEIIDNDGNIKTKTGHFSLIRK